MGSQAILGTYEEDVLPAAATMSMEADVAFLDDQDRAKADLVTSAIGEDSNFHQLRGYYAEGIHVEAATLPENGSRAPLSIPWPSCARQGCSKRWVAGRPSAETTRTMLSTSTLPIRKQPWTGADAVSAVHTIRRRPTSQHRPDRASADLRARTHSACQKSA